MRKVAAALKFFETYGFTSVLMMLVVDAVIAGVVCLIAKILFKAKVDDMPAVFGVSFIILAVVELFLLLITM